jgi:hypothetical protein
MDVLHECKHSTVKCEVALAMCCISCSCWCSSEFAQPRAEKCHTILLHYGVIVHVPVCTTQRAYNVHSKKQWQCPQRKHRVRIHCADTAMCIAQSADWCLHSASSLGCVTRLTASLHSANKPCACRRGQLYLLMSCHQHLSTSWRRAIATAGMIACAVQAYIWYASKLCIAQVCVCRSCCSKVMQCTCWRQQIVSTTRIWYAQG